MVDNGNGTVTDEATGLMWQQETSGAMTWALSLSFCGKLSLAGYIDWRLPTIKELQNIVDYSRNNPAINTMYFPNTAASWYWSSTTHVGNTNHAWLVDFGYGYVSGYYKFPAGYVRAVRGGQPE